MIAVLAGLMVMVAASRVAPQRPTVEGSLRLPKRPLASRSPGIVHRLLEPRRRRALQREVPLALEGLARSLRSGASVRQALIELAATDVGPLARDLQRVVADLDRGRPLPAALDDWVAGTPLPAVRLAVAVLQTGLAAGGPSAQLVDKVAATVRDQHRLDLEVAALSSQARASALVIVLAPIGFTVFTAVVDPVAAAFLYRSTIGRLCLLVGLVLDLVGWLWMNRLTRVVAR